MAFTRVKTNRDLLFWSLHAMGWSAYGIAQYLGAVLYDEPDAYVTLIFVAAVSGFALSAPLRQVCRRLWSRPPAVMIAGAISAAYVIALLWRIVVNWSYQRLIDEHWPAHWYEYVMGAMSATYLLVCWVGLYFGFRYYESLQRQREAALRAATLAQEAQLKMLRYQLNPHFLFNTLNAISTLILDDRNRTANDAVTGLADFLRYTLDQDPMKKVTLAQELDALGLYLGIEKMRFAARLQIEYSIDDAASAVLMPSLLLQPLIENAIKYAVSPREEGGRICVRARVSGGMLHLEVADDGPGMTDAVSPAASHGVGLRNTRDRLQVLYGERGTVWVHNTQPGLRVALTFPAETAP
jgi:signal transduction histidine kinase